MDAARQEPFIVDGGTCFPHVPDDMSLGEFLYAQIRAGGDKVAYLDDSKNREMTFNSMLKLSLTFSKSLKAFGIKKNDVVAVCSENCPEFCVSVVGALFTTATVATLNFLYTPFELNHCINVVKPKLIVCSVNTIKNVSAVLNDCPSIQTLVIINKNDLLLQNGITAISFNKMVHNFDKTDVNDVTFEKVNQNHDLVVLMNSSGTTGLPKSVMMTHKNLLTGIEAFKDPETGIVNLTHTVMFLPMFHAFGFRVFLYSLVIHSKVVIMRRFDEERLLQLIEKHRVAQLFLVPSLIVLLTKSQKTHGYDLSSLVQFHTGTAPLSEEMMVECTKKFGLKNIRHSYAMTESTFGITRNPHNRVKHGSVGRPLRGVLVKVVNVNSGKNLGPNEKGEICYTGALRMKGYMANPKATNETIDSLGWLHSGDLGYYDDDGYFYIVERLKELIKYKGFQVPPAELEALLLQNPKVKDVGVVGKADVDVGEKAVAFVVLQPNAKASEQEIVQFVSDRISPQKRLYGGVRFVNEIPKNPSGKILRKDLRKLLESELKAKL